MPTKKSKKQQPKDAAKGTKSQNKENELPNNVCGTTQSISKNEVKKDKDALKNDISE